MYTPQKFREDDPAALQAVMHAHPLATIVVHTPDGLLANHVPLEFAAEGPHGTLRGHIARANPLWRQYPAGSEALAIFQGPNAYISPNFYPSKAEKGEAVPTWNYAVVQVRGTLAFTHDAPWLHALVTRLTDRHEQGSAHPWAVADAPAAFTAHQVGLIVGVELPISSVMGKFKLSQNRTDADRQGVRDGLAARGGESATEMLGLLRR